MIIKRVRIKFEKLFGETPKAFLVKINNGEYWFPWRYTYNFTVNKKLGGHFECPAWLYKEKFGREPDESIATLMIEKHTPEKKEKVLSNEINELRK